jgi:hypothetical protein
LVIAAISANSPTSASVAVRLSFTEASRAPAYPRRPQTM